MLNINIIKCPIPSIWIDTSIIIKLAQMRSGQNINKLDRERLTFIYDQVYDLVRKKKLICPLG
ncbi:MAG: hypothetical protein ACFFFT_05590 [Candidatus Thorarchaeota archaeon]